MKAGWPVKPIGELCDIIGGGTPSKANAAFYNGGIPWATVRDMKADWIEATEHSITPEAVKASATNVLPSGTVVIASRVGLGKICRVSNDTAINQDLRGFIPKPKAQLDIQYLFWWFKSVAEQIVAAGNGATVQGVTLPFLRSLQIPLPPLDEQRRIVAVLDQAFAGIATATANAQKNLTNTRELSTACSVGGSTAERITIGELLERGWLLGHMDGNHGGDYPRKDEFVSEGVKYLSANSIRDGVIDFDRAKFLSPARAANLRKGFARNRDVLFAHNATVGPVALLETHDDFVVLGTSLTYYRCDESRIKPEYLASYLASSAFKVQYEAVMRQSTRNQVPITKQREFFVDVPPIEEQSQMVASLVGFQEGGRRLVTQYQSKLAALTELKQSLLQKAFAGELT